MTRRVATPDPDHAFYARLALVVLTVLHAERIARRFKHVIAISAAMFIVFVFVLGAATG